MIKSLFVLYLCLVPIFYKIKKNENKQILNKQLLKKTVVTLLNRTIHFSFTDNNTLQSTNYFVGQITQYAILQSTVNVLQYSAHCAVNYISPYFFCKLHYISHCTLQYILWYTTFHTVQYTFLQLFLGTPKNLLLRSQLERVGGGGACSAAS